jgi:MFS family permease
VGRIYYGWCVTAVAVLVYMLIVGSTVGAFGLFVLPVSEELKLSRAEMNTAMILMNLGFAGLAPLVGWLLDRFPVRRVQIVSGLVFGAGLALLGVSRSIPLSAGLLLAAVPLGYLGVGTLTMSVLLARWFVLHRGRAMALAGIGMSLGNVTVTPLVGLLVEAEGWRTALLIMGAVLAPLLAGLGLLVRDPGADDREPGRPSAAAAAPAAPTGAPTGAPTAAPKAAPAGFGVILRLPQFWSLGLSAAMAMSVAQAVAVTLVPLGRESGLSTMQAASLMSVLGAGAITGALIAAAIADRLDRILLLTAILALGGVVNALLPFAHGYGLLLGGAGLLGVTMGGLTPVFFALLADRFGTPSFGTVRGLTMPLVAAMGMVAIRFAGEVFDRTGGYDAMFQAFVAAQLVSAALMFATRFTRPLQPSAATSAASG